MKALYITDEIDTCDCCGRTDLKATVAMQLSDGGILHYGRTCAARNSGKDQRQIKKEIIQEANDNAGRASNEWRFSTECRALREYRQSAPWATIGWVAYEASSVVQAAEAKRAEIAARHRTSASLF
jgi:hypothetical protein